MMLSIPVQSSRDNEGEDEGEGTFTIHKLPNCIGL